MSRPQAAAHASTDKEPRSRRVQVDPVMDQPVALSGHVGLSIAVVELLANAAAAKRATYWWSKFWARITARGSHWLWRGPESLLLGDRLVTVRDVAYVWAREDLEPGETTEPVCGHSDCVKHLRIVAAHQLAA